MLDICEKSHKCNSPKYTSIECKDAMDVSSNCKRNDHVGNMKYATRYVTGGLMEKSLAALIE